MWSFVIAWLYAIINPDRSAGARRSLAPSVMISVGTIFPKIIAAVLSNRKSKKT
jgi:hypothetical protein